MRAQARRLSAAAEQTVAQLAAHPAVDPAAVHVLRTVLNVSPDLAAQVNTAVAVGDLRGFEPLPPTSSTGGEYHPDTKIIRVAVRILTPSQMNEIAFVMGHEVQHALNRRATQRAVDTFHRDVVRTASSDHDYTAAVDRLLSAQRADEASANVAGWNALAGYREFIHGRVTIDDMARANPRTRDAVARDPLTGRHRLRDGFKINSAGRLGQSSENVRAMARTYVDKAATNTRLGHNRNSDYANYYAAYAISVAARAHQRRNPVDATGRMVPMKINLASLRLTRELIEQNGLNLLTGQAVPYVDTSTHPPTSGHFHHTAATHTFVPVRQPAPGRTTADRPNLAATLAHMTFTGTPRRAQVSAKARPSSAHTPPGTRQVEVGSQR